MPVMILKANMRRGPTVRMRGEAGSTQIEPTIIPKFKWPDPGKTGK